MRGSLQTAPTNVSQIQDHSTPPAAQAQKTRGGAPGAPGRRTPGRGKAPNARTVHPVLEQLASLHPQLFGARFLPLKLGTYQDLMEAHPGLFTADDLKEALRQHTRSTRYLDSVARGLQRHDLAGQPVAPLAPEHIHHAVVELFRRRQARSQEDLQPALRQQLRALFVASGLDRAAYAAAAKIDVDAFSALLDQADFDQADAIARREALLRAFEASGGTVAVFADTYGMAVADVDSTLAQARDDRRVKASRPAA